MGEAVNFNRRAAGHRHGECKSDDVLTATFETLIARVRPVTGSHVTLASADIELIERARSAIKVTSRKVSDLEARIDVLQRLAVTDELTGVLNRRGFSRELERALARAQRYGDEGALIYIDIDAFKRINDAFGHAAGDAVLRHVGQLLNASVRCTDHVGRLGGDEFAVLLARASIAGSRKRADHLEQRLRGAEVIFDGHRIPLSVSVGIQIYGRNHCLDVDALLEGADRAMYAEKNWRRAHGGRQHLAIAS